MYVAQLWVTITRFYYTSFTTHELMQHNFFFLNFLMYFGNFIREITKGLHNIIDKYR